MGRILHFFKGGSTSSSEFDGGRSAVTGKVGLSEEFTVVAMGKRHEEENETTKFRLSCSISTFDVIGDFIGLFQSVVK